MRHLNFGKVTYQDGYWTVVTDPSVRTRLRRVFPRVSQDGGSTIRISASLENSRELEWFLMRYPMEVDRPELLRELSSEHFNTEEKVYEMLMGHIAPEHVEMALPPREYQLYASQMLEVVKGMLLADDLGLGKTVSSICAAVKPKNLPALIVCPAHLPRQWQKMFAKFAPHLRTHILKKGTPYDLLPKTKPRQRELLPTSIPDVIITSYHKLRGWDETLAGVVQFVVFDECQALRHPDTRIYAAAKRIADATPLRLGNSATPIHNYGGEFYHVLDVLSPGALGDLHEFQRERCKSAPGGKHALKDPAEFGEYLRRTGLMLRRTRADVGRELPPLTKIVHEIEADEAAFAQLQGDAIALARIIVKNNEKFRGERFQASGEFDNLMRQATGIAKAPYVAEFVRLLLDSGEPIVLFGWHRAVYDIWLEELAEFNPVMYTGSESDKQKDDALAEFLSGRSKLMIMSLRSGAGVDGLQNYCHIGVFGEFDWSHAVHKQCIGRYHRDQQGNPCTAYYMLSNSGSDPIMAEVLGLKREQLELVIDPDMPFAEQIDNGETNIGKLARDFLLRHGGGEVIDGDPADVPSPFNPADIEALA